MTMADTVAVMNKGRIEQMGAPEKLYELPETVFVANFLGQSNLFTVGITGENGSALHAKLGGEDISFLKEKSQRHTGTVTVGVRPEKLRLHTERPAAASGVNILGPGRITDVSFIGVSTQYTVESEEFGTLQIFAQNVEAGPAASLGQDVYVSWLAEHTFGLLDDPTGTTGVDAQMSTVMLSQVAAQ